MLQRKTKATFQPTCSKTVDNSAEFDSAIRKHDRYLIALEKQKQLSKNLQRKGSAEEAKEKREKGFSVYVNGANALPQRKTISKLNNLPKSKHYFPKPVLTYNSPRNDKRATSAPGGKSTRRFWCQESVEIATDSGAKLYASLRSLNAKYSDDFEADSMDFEKSYDEKYPVNSKNSQLRPTSVPPLSNRKYWGQGSVTIKASTGENLRASISNVTDYSMNFEDDSDATLTDSDEEIVEEIESDKTGTDEFTEDLLILGKDKPFEIHQTLSNSNSNT